MSFGFIYSKVYRPCTCLSYCMSMYTEQMRYNPKSSTNQRGAMAKQYKSYHNVLKMFFGLSKLEISSLVCAYKINTELFSLNQDFF